MKASYMHQEIKMEKINMRQVDIPVIFLIRDSDEYRSAIDIIGSENLTEYGIFTIKDVYPYLVDDIGIPDIHGSLQRWKDHGVISTDFSRYWLDEYKIIEEVISAEMGGNEKYDNCMVQSQNFKFGLVWFLGQRYYEPVVQLNEFIKNHKPETIYFKPTNSFISNLIYSFAGMYKMECRSLIK